MLRDQVFVLDHMYMSLFSTCGWILRLGVTVALLMSIHPVLALLVVFALPTVFTSTWRPGVERAAEERGAPANRLARHLFNTATTAPPGKEVRVTRIGDRLAKERREAWERWYGPVAAARWGSAVWHALAWAIFGAATWARWSSFPRDRARRRVKCCWCWRRARGSRPTSAQRSEKSDSCAASGWMVRGAWRGSKITPRRSRSTPTAPAPERLVEGHPLRARVVRLSGNRAPRARRRQPGAEARVRGRHRRRERGGQKHAGEAAVPDVPARPGAHSGRWRGSRADSRRRMAVPAGGRVSGFLPLRVSGAPYRGRGRRAAAR